MNLFAASQPGGPLGRYLLNPSALPDAIAALLRNVEAAWPILVPAIGTIGALAIWSRSRLTQRRHARMSQEARCVEILAPPNVESSGGEVLWAQLAGLLRPWWRRLVDGQPHLAFEYAWSSRGMIIGLWLPGGVPLSLVRRAVEAAWPGAHTAVTDAAAPLTAGRLAVVGALRLARPEVLPLRTRFDADPLRPLLQAATGMGDAEAAVVQILARPAAGGRLRRARRLARRVKAGQAPSRVLALLDLLTHAAQRGAADKLDPAHGTEVRAVVGKLCGPHWDVAVRYAATHTTDHPDAEPVLRGRVHALASAFTLFAEHNWLARTRLRDHTPITERRFPRRGSLMSVAELAALAHLPTDPDAPGLARAGARGVIPPAAIPTPGPDVKPLGVSDTGTPRPVGVSVPDARQHLHVLGATGSGKSTLLAQQVLSDVTSGRGAVVVDPKGDLVRELLDRLPETAADRLVLIDPDDHHPHAPVMNVFDGADPDTVVDNICGIFRRIYTGYWGPRTDDVMRAACLTLVRRGRPDGAAVTLADVPRILGDAPFRRRTTVGISATDPVLGGFWTWYESLSEQARATVTGPVLNKLRAFLLRPFVHRTIASGHSTFEISNVLDGGLLLARLPKGSLGQETTSLLGSFVVAQVWQAAAARASTPEHRRKDAALVLDECHNFLNLPYPIEDMLAEARAYRLGLTLAHQNLAQLPTELREGISANARSKVFFNASPEDARQLERHTLPALAAHDLAHLGGYQAAARLLVDGTQTTAFTLTTRPLPAAVRGRATALRRAVQRSTEAAAQDTSTRKAEP